MTNEELDEARAQEAQRLWESGQEAGSSSWAVAARLARENWTPPEPVDPDLLAYREWASKKWPSEISRINAGRYDNWASCDAYLAGARMAREQEQERAKEAVDFVRRFAAVNAPQFLVPPVVQERPNINAPYIGTPHIGTSAQFRIEDWVMHPSPSPSVVEARDILAKYNGEA